MSDEEQKPPVYKRKPIGPFAIVSAELYANRKIRKAKSLGCQVFVFALTRNAARGRTGVLDAAELEAEYVADMLQISVQEAEEGVQLAIAAGLLTYEPEADQISINGWDETWARAPMTEAERERKATYREKKKTENQTKKEDREQTQTQKKRSPGRVRDMSGTGVFVPLSPPITAQEKQVAESLMSAISAYTGHGYSSGLERDRIAELLRAGHLPLHLEALAVYTCHSDGAGWYDRTDKDGHHNMRAHCCPMRIFSGKNVRDQLSMAVGTVMRGDLYNTEELTARLKAFEIERARKGKAA